MCKIGSFSLLGTAHVIKMKVCKGIKYINRMSRIPLFARLFWIQGEIIDVRWNIPITLTLGFFEETGTEFLQTFCDCNLPWGVHHLGDLWPSPKVTSQRKNECMRYSSMWVVWAFALFLRGVGGGLCVCLFGFFLIYIENKKMFHTYTYRIVSVKRKKERKKEKKNFRLGEHILPVTVYFNP